MVAVDGKVYNLQSNTPYEVTVGDGVLHLIKKPNQQVLLEATVRNKVVICFDKNASNDDVNARFDFR